VEAELVQALAQHQRFGGVVLSIALARSPALAPSASYSPLPG
jgi:hypothetical protein